MSIQEQHYYKAWLSQLFEGQSVLVEYDGIGQPRNPNSIGVGKVVKVLPSQVIVKMGEEERRFNKRNGTEVWKYHWYLAPATEEEIYHITLASDVYRTLWYDLPNDVLESVTRMVEAYE